MKGGVGKKPTLPFFYFYRLKILLWSLILLYISILRANIFLSYRGIILLVRVLLC
jgi:hypothetical protein